MMRQKCKVCGSEKFQRITRDEVYIERQKTGDLADVLIENAHAEYEYRCIVCGCLKIGEPNET